MNQDTKQGQDMVGDTGKVRRDGLAAVAIVLLTVGLIVLVVSSLV